MHYADYKTILSPTNGMNLYRGCSHGCIYCDSLSTCYQMNHDFEDIEIKRDAALILEQQLKRRRRRGMIATGAMSDPYMNFTETLAITRECLQMVERYGFGLAIQTKSALILRDLDILKSIHQTSRCVVEITLTTYDEKLCSILEPRVSTTEERVMALETLREAGIPTVVWLSPFLPFINDTEENLRGLLSNCIQTGVQAILAFGFGMTLREGNREYFYARLDESFPGMKERYMRSFGSSYHCVSPSGPKLRRLFEAECIKHGIIYGEERVFSWIKQYREREEQLNLF